MDRSNLTLSIGSLGILALVIGVSGPVLAMGPSAGPVGEIQATLGIILDRLDDLQEDVDDLQEDVGPCEVPPVWGKKFAGADRFVAVLDGAAYCDQETGLVWEQSPDPTPQGSWAAAIGHCATLEVDDRKGWSLPMREQLASLVDETGTGVDSNGDPLKLPDGHPFDPAGVQSRFYWSASTSAINPSVAWSVSFFFGDLFIFSKVDVNKRAWCVRGGQAFDGNTHDTLH